MAPQSMLSCGLLRRAVFLLESVAAIGAATLSCFAAENTRKLDVAEIQKLADALASPNPKPILPKEKFGLGPRYQLPAGYDRKAQDRVHAAREELLAAGLAAFPYLIERFDDHAYCLTSASEATDIWHHVSVGGVCQEIVEHQIEAWGPWRNGRGIPPERGLRPSYCEKHLPDKTNAQKWWQTHKDKSLREIQIKALEWVIVEETKRAKEGDLEDAAALEHQLQELRKSKKPLSPLPFSAGGMKVLRPKDRDDDRQKTPPPFDPKIVTKKGDDAVAVKREGEKVILAVTSRSGIGKATITPAAKWPKMAVLRLHLRGLESLRISDGQTTLEASVSSHGDGAVRLNLRDGNNEKPVDAKSPYWTEVRILDAQGKPVKKLPLQDGCFELQIPSALLPGEGKTLELFWIDFYRG